MKLNKTMFNLALEKFTMESEIENNGTLYNKSTQIFCEADDVVIVGKSIVELKERVKQIMKSTQVIGINMQKTKYVEITKKN